MQPITVYLFKLTLRHGEEVLLEDLGLVIQALALQHIGHQTYTVALLYANVSVRSHFVLNATKHIAIRSPWLTSYSWTLGRLPRHRRRPPPWA